MLSSPQQADGLFDKRLIEIQLTALARAARSIVSRGRKCGRPRGILSQREGNHVGRLKTGVDGVSGHRRRPHRILPALLTLILESRRQWIEDVLREAQALNAIGLTTKCYAGPLQRTGKPLGQGETGTAVREPWASDWADP